MVHLYDEVEPEELYEICRDRLADIESIHERILDWVRPHEADGT